MKKFLSVLTVSSALLLTACGNDTADTAEGNLEDGSYRVEDANFDGNGWKEALDVVIEDGKITDASWESVNEEGDNKIEDEGYQEAMTNAVDLGPQDFIPALQTDLVDKQDPAEVDIITGATGTAEKFKDYATQAVEAAEEGNTETIVVDNPAE